MSLIDEIKIDTLQEAQEILKGIGSEELFEKAHKDGDMHPNGKWVWVSSAAGGKGDWRTLNGRTHKKHQSVTDGGSSATGNGGKSSTTQPTSTSGNNTTTASTIRNSQTTDGDFTIDKQRYDVQLKLAQRTINHDGDTANVKVGLSVTQEGIKKLQEKIADLRKNRPGAKKTIKTEEDKLNKLKTNEKAMRDAIKEFEGKKPSGSKTKTQDGGDIKTLSSKDFDKNPKLLDSLLKNANVKKNDKGETFYHVTISSHGVKKHNLWLSKPEVKSRLSKILNPYDEVTAVSKEEDGVKSEEVKKKVASIKPHIVTDASLGEIEYFDYDENKKKRLHDLSSDAAYLSNGKSKNLGFDYKTDDGRSVHIDIKVTKNKKENTFEIKNGSKGDTIEFSISNQMSYDIQNRELDDKIKESIESRVNKGIKTPAASKNKIETDGSKLTLTQRKQNLSNVVDKFKTAIQDKIKELKLNSEYKIETGDRYISVSRKNSNFRKGAGSGGTFAFDYNGKGNKLMITRKAALSGSTEFDFDENDIKDNVDKFFKFYSIK